MVTDPSSLYKIKRPVVVQICLCRINGHRLASIWALNAAKRRRWLHCPTVPLFCICPCNYWYYIDIIYLLCTILLYSNTLCICCTLLLTSYLFYHVYLIFVFVFSFKYWPSNVCLLQTKSWLEVFKLIYLKLVVYDCICLVISVPSQYKGDKLRGSSILALIINFVRHRGCLSSQLLEGLYHHMYLGLLSAIFISYDDPLNLADRSDRACRTYVIQSEGLSERRMQW